MATTMATAHPSVFANYIEGSYVSSESLGIKQNLGRGIAKEFQDLSGKTLCLLAAIFASADNLRKQI